MKNNSTTKQPLEDSKEQDNLTDRLLDNPMQEEEDFKDFLDAAYPDKPLPDSKEGLHTQGEWTENPNETAYRSIGIIHIKNERGFLFEEIAEVKFNWDKYPENPNQVKEEAFANAELIVKAVNEYPKLKKNDEIATSLLKVYENERKALLDSNNELISALEKIINDFLGKVKPETYNQIETAINNAKNIKQ